MMYVLLAIAVVVLLVCGIGIIKNSKSNAGQGDHGLALEGMSDGNSDSAKTKVEDLSNQENMGFDQLVSDSKQAKEIEMKIEEVPVIVYFQDTYDKKPLLILQHGITSKKEDVADLAKNLSQAGYVVVTPDAVGHGGLASSEEKTVAQLIKETGENFETVISYFADSMYVEISRTGIVGFSLGGLAAFHYTANGAHQPKVVVSLCSTPDFETLADSSVANIVFVNEKETAVGDKKKCEQIAEAIRAESPYGKLINNTETCFYLLCGDKDDIVPHEGNLRFYDEMKDKANDIVLKVKENQKHEVKVEDLEEVLQYLKGHL